MRRGPMRSPCWRRYNCSKKGMSAATFSTGRSAPEATFSLTKLWASKRTFAETGTGRGLPLLAAVFKDPFAECFAAGFRGAAVVWAGVFFPPLEAYFFVLD